MFFRRWFLPLKYALKPNSPCQNDTHYFSTSQYFTGKELHVDALEIRQSLIEVALQKRRQGVLLIMSLFNFSPVKNPLLNFENLVSKEHVRYLNLLDSTCSQLILAEHLPLLRKFFNDKQKENSNLGNLYRGLTFNQMIVRFIKARYETAYQDGRLVTYRSNHHEFHKFLEHLSDREKLLVVGTQEDEWKLYEHYLSLEESAISHLVFAGGYFLAVNNAIRHKAKGIGSFRPGNFLNELKNSHSGPVLVTYAVGPELRDGRSLHYDALMCLEYADEKPGHPHYERRAEALHQHGFSCVIEDLYGSEYPQAHKGRGKCELIEVQLPAGVAYFYVNAYKTRIRHTLKQTLIANELLLPQKGTLRLKGFGLGVFGVSSLEESLELIYLKVLNELLHSLALKKINKIELVNFPSTLRPFHSRPEDLDFFMEHGNDLNKPAIQIDHPDIKVVHVMVPCLNSTDDNYLSTQICGDSISCPGNEGAIGLPPSSSDEAAMFYALGGVTSMRNHTYLHDTQLVQKIIVMNDASCTKLNGTKASLELSSIQLGNFNFKSKMRIHLKTEKLEFGDAAQVMDHSNAVKGVMASWCKEEGRYWSAKITLYSDYDRDRFFCADLPTSAPVNVKTCEDGMRSRSFFLR